MKSVSIVLAITLVVGKVLVATSSSTTQLRGLKSKSNYGFQTGHERITKSVYSSSDNYGYGGEFYGSFSKESKAKKEEVNTIDSTPKESKAKKGESKKDIKSLKPAVKEEHPFTYHKGISKKGKYQSKEAPKRPSSVSSVKASAFLSKKGKYQSKKAPTRPSPSKKSPKGSSSSKKKKNRNPYNLATGSPSISPVVASTETPTTTPSIPPAVASTDTPTTTPSLQPAVASTDTPTTTPSTEATIPPVTPTETPATQSPTYTASTTTQETFSPTSTSSTTTPATTFPTASTTTEPPTTAPPSSAPFAPPTTVSPTQAPITPTVSPVEAPSIAPSVATTPAPTSATLAPIPSTAPSAQSTSASVAQRILPYALQGGEEFISSTSYQSQSLSFVASIPGVNDLTDAKIVQYYALGCIYYATYAVPNPATDALLGKGVIPPGWNSSTNWLNLTLDPCSGANETVSGWNGVGCEGGRVTRLNLPKNDLTGTFPPEITILSADHPSNSGNLNYVELSSNINLFAHNLDSWIGKLGSNLEFLYFSGTSFFSTNGVPDAISNLTNLKELDCSYSLLTGPLREAPFRGLNNAVFVVLSGNAYNSTIPTVFTSLPSLQYLYLQNAFLSGDLSFAQGLQNIQELWVDQNPGISGPVSPFFGDLPTLHSLSLTDNSLTGTLPSEISRLPNILSMWFYNNRLGGTFPQEWSSLTSLQKLEIEANTISGNLTTFCERLGPPSGVLKVLGADCMNLTECPCCTCCSLKECNAIFRL